MAQGENTGIARLQEVTIGSENLFELLDRTDGLVTEVQKALQRIGVELAQLGIPPSILPISCHYRAHPEFGRLSPREMEVVRLFMEGHRVSNIAGVLYISQHTVRNHLQSVYRKLGVSSQAELIEKLKRPAIPVLVRDRSV